MRFHVANTGNTRHTLRVEGPGVAGGSVVTPLLFVGGAATLHVVFEHPGDYLVYCDVGFHAGAGMVTTLAVTG